VVGVAATELGLQPVVRAVADVLARHSNEAGKAAGHPLYGLKVATIAAEAGYSVRHVHRGLRALECSGLLVVERRPGHDRTARPSIYHLAVRAWSLGAKLLGRWRDNITAKRAAHQPPAAPYPSGTFVCAECGWEGVRGPCPVAHDPP
jgi:hypothetical protein